jgi:hypothetical protein
MAVLCVYVPFKMFKREADFHNICLQKFILLAANRMA